MGTVSKEINTAHSDYTDIHAEWVRQGRPAQFDRSGDFGGALYEVLDTSAENPVFYMVASMGPTTWDEEAHGKVEKGWGFINEDYWRERVTVREVRCGLKYEVEMIAAPNELEVE